MRRRLLLYASIAAFVLAAAPLAAQQQGLGKRELLGVRIGGDISPGTLENTFGGGSSIEIHFIHAIRPWCGVDVSLNTHDFGASSNKLKNMEFTGADREVSLEMYGVTAGFIAVTVIGKKVLPTIEAGAGLYSVNAVLESGFFNAAKTEFRPGLYGGIGAIYKVTGGFALNAAAKFHYVFSGSNPDNTVYFFTGHSYTDIFQISFGVLIAAG